MVLIFRGTVQEFVRPGPTKAQIEMERKKASRAQRFAASNEVAVTGTTKIKLATKREAGPVNNAVRAKNARVDIRVSISI